LRAFLLKTLPNASEFPQPPSSAVGLPPGRGCSEKWAKGTTHMNPAQWQQIRPILESALELTPASRKNFLDRACTEPSLRLEVESLLISHDQADRNRGNPRPRSHEP
jgi:hypothetical protein